MAVQNTVRFRLEGLDYALRGEKSAEQLQQIVDMVCDKVEDIKKIAPHYSAVRISTLAALQLASELAEAREETRLLLEEAATQSLSAPRKRRTPRPAAEPEEPEMDVLFPDLCD